MQRFCTHCGAPIDSSANFCANCGKRTAPAANQTKKRLILIGAAVVVCVIVAILCFFIGRSTAHNDPSTVTAPAETNATDSATAAAPQHGMNEPEKTSDSTVTPQHKDPHAPSSNESDPASDPSLSPSDEAPAEKPLPDSVEETNPPAEQLPEPDESTDSPVQKPAPAPEQDAPADDTAEPTDVMTEQIERCLDRELYLFADSCSGEYSACLGDYQSFPSYTENWTFRNILDKDLFDAQNWFFPAADDTSVIRFNGTANTPDEPWDVTIEFTFSDEDTPPLVSYYIEIPEDGTPNDVSAYEYSYSPLSPEEIVEAVDATACCFLIALDPDAMAAPEQPSERPSFDSSHVYESGDVFTLTGYLIYNPTPGGWSEDFCYIETPEPYRYIYMNMDDEWYEQEEDRIYFLFKEDSDLLEPYDGQLLTVSGTFCTEMHGVPYLSPFSFTPVQ